MCIRDSAKSFQKVRRRCRPRSPVVCFVFFINPKSSQVTSAVWDRDNFSKLQTACDSVLRVSHCYGMCRLLRWPTKKSRPFLYAASSLFVLVFSGSFSAFFFFFLFRPSFRATYVCRLPSFLRVFRMCCVFRLFFGALIRRESTREERAEIFSR